MPMESITRTIKCPLETSDSKNKLLKEGVDEFQDIMEYTVDLMPGIPEGGWVPNNNVFYRLTVSQKDGGEFSDGVLTSSVGREAGQKVAEMYQSWKQRGKVGNRPQVGGREYLRLPGSQYDVVENERGFGLKASFIPYNPVWWHMDIGSYQSEYLRRVLSEDGDARLGSAEISYDDGSPVAHIVVTWDVEVAEVEDCSVGVGVDIGEDVIFALAARDLSSEEVLDVEMERGSEFRHHRERLTSRRDELQEKGDLKGVRETRNERERYTEQVTHRVSREVVRSVESYESPVIRLEELTGYRDSARNPIHDWPYALLQEKIAYKAREAGVPVEMVDPAYTSQTCRKCGSASSSFRDGSMFCCSDCGYEVHADVNAAMNIAVDMNG